SDGALQKIQNAIGDINQNLPALLAAAHISDATLETRIAAAVGLIVATVDSFGALIPAVSPAVNPETKMAMLTGRKTLPIPRAKELKRQWNGVICAPTGNAGLDGALAAGVVR